MNKQEIKEKVTAIIVDKLGVEPDVVKDDAKFGDDLGGDSLDFVEAEIAFEKEFGITIPDDRFCKCETIGEMCDFIEKQMQ